LRQVLGLRSVSREPVADVKDAPAVATHKFLPGRPVALEAVLDQLGILLQRIFSLRNLLRCKARLRAGFLSKTVWQSISACQLWNVKCSRNVPLRIRPELPTVLLGILLTAPLRHKKINQIAVPPGLRLRSGVIHDHPLESARSARKGQLLYEVPTLES